MQAKSVLRDYLLALPICPSMSLFLSLVFSTAGLAYFVYGKKQASIGFMVAGLVLCVYPYFVSGLAMMTVLGLLLLAAPFIAMRLGL